MRFAVYVDGEGYIGDVLAPTRASAVDILASFGYDPETLELREVFE